MEGLVSQVAAAAEVAAGAVAAGVSTEDETARPADAEDNDAALEGDSSATVLRNEANGVRGGLVTFEWVC